MSGNNITETGPLNFRQLQEQNNEHQTHGSNDLLNPELVKRLEEGVNNLGSHSAYNIEDTIPYYEDSDVKQTDYDQNRGWWDADRSDYFGKSFWDNPEEVVYGDDINAAERRAQNQWAIAKLGAGITKCLGTAVTTFLQGTAGLLYGTAETMAATGDENQSWAQTFSHIFNNEVTNGLSEFNESMDIWLPNYRTQEEKDNAWTQNLGTMNFWSDNVIKNLGFTIGAVASGKALVGILDKAIKLGPVGVRLAGSLFGAASEASFEANNLYRDYTKAQYEKAAHHFGVDVHLIEEDERFDALRKDIDERASRAGIIDMVANIALLTAGDYAVFGKLFTKGISSAEKAVTQSEVSKRISQKAYDVAKGLIGNYDAKIKGTKGAIKKTFGDMITEGHEELAQNFISSFSGAMYDPDSPDTYYKIGRDKTYTVEANNVLDGMTKAIGESYLNFDKWEEFFAGSMTALLGVPTFGKASNASSATWLGKNKTIGISGGLFGNIAETKEVDEEASKEVASLNGIIDKLNKQSHFFAHNMSYTDRMNRYRAEGKKFEYKNNEDNSDFEVLDIFSQFNRLDDLKRIVDQDIESLRERDIIAVVSGNTRINPQTGNAVGWFNNAGNAILKKDGKGNAYIDKDDMGFVKEELKKKQDTLKQKFDDYVTAKEEVGRYPITTTFSDANRQELTWLKWKKKQFDNRVYDMAVEGKDSFQKLASWISAGVDDMQREIDKINDVKNLAVSTTDEEGNKTIHLSDSEKKRVKREEKLKESIEHGNKILEVLNKLIESASSINKGKEAIAMDIERLLERNKKFVEDLTNNQSKNEYDAFALDKLETDMQIKAHNLIFDINRALQLKNEFTNRLNEFISNPEKINEERQKEEEKTKEDAQKAKSTVEQQNKKDEVKTKSVSEIVESLQKDANEKKALEDIINSQSASAEEKQKAKSALEINDAYNKALDLLKAKLDKKEITPQQYALVKNILVNNANNANSLEEFKSTDTYSALDPFDGLSKSDVDLINQQTQGLDPSDMKMKVEDLVDSAKSVVAEIFGEISDYGAVSDEDKKSALEKPAGEVKIGDEGVTTANDVQKRKDEENKKQKEKEESNKKLDELIKQLSENMVTEIVKPEALQQDENTRKTCYDVTEAFVRACFELVQDNPNTENSILLDNIKNSTRYKSFDQLLGDLVANDLFNGEKELVEQAKSEMTSMLIQIAKHWFQTLEKQAQNNTSISDEEARTTETPMSEEQPGPASDENVEKKEISHAFWRATTNEVPNPFIEGDMDLAAALRKAGYKEEVIQRIMKIHEHLKAADAFHNAFNLKEKDRIYFGTDKQLNQKLAGEGKPIEEKDIVILMYDSSGLVVGDLTLPELNSFSTQKGLAAFREQFLKEYREHKDEDVYISKTLQTTVNQKLIGKMPYSKKSDRHTLQEIFVEKNIQGETKLKGFKLAVMTNSGFNCKNVNPEDIMMPLHSKPGWVYVLYPTGCNEEGRKWFPVPIIMKRFGQDTSNTSKGKTVRKLLEEIKGTKNVTHKSLMDLKNGLQRVLYLPEVHANYENGVFQLTVKQGGNLHQAVLYEGPLSDMNIDTVISNLYGTPFQVVTSRLNDVDSIENRAVSEVSSCNLIVGQTIPFGSWFTVNPILFGEEIQAERLETIGYNPTVSSGKTYTVTVTYKKSGTHVYTMDQEDPTVVMKDNNPLPIKDMDNNDKSTCARMWTDITGVLKGKTQTPFGDYDIDNNKLVGEEQEQEPEPGSIADLGSENIVDEMDFNPADLIGMEDLKSGNVNWFGGSGGSNQSSEQKGSQQLASTPEPQQGSSENPQQDIKTKFEEYNTGNDKLDNSLKAYSGELEKLGYLDNVKSMSEDDQVDLSIKIADFGVEAGIKEFFGLNREIDNSIEYTQIDIEKEKEWLKRVLPQFSDKEHLRIISAAQENSKKHVSYWGKFKDGIITIVKDAARGTLFHEAFHAVSQSLLSEKERKFMYKEAAKVYGNKADILLEEQLAESFRKYVQIEETPVVGSVIKLFRTLKHMVFNLAGAEPYLDSLYYRICRGSYSNQNINTAKSYSEAVRQSDKKAKEVARQIKRESKEMEITNNENNKWGSLPSSAIDYLKSCGITQKEWDNLHSDIREKMLICMP